jgi:non-specific serine/threonine protein kinase
VASHNLPNVLTSFIGREKEITELTQLLDQTRLLTLTGAGGSGKTRLALEVAARVSDSFEHGVWWVELAALTDATLVPQEVAKALDLRESSGQSLIQTLVNDLRPKHLLLVLDNCEHLITACTQLTDSLLPECPNLKILITGRERMGSPHETTWLVPSLSMPPAVRLPQHADQLLLDLKQSDAIRLFIERARAVSPTFMLTNQNRNAIGQVCQRVDGLPLAIELAAARVNVLTVQQIAERLDDRFALLTGGNRLALIPRHQTLRLTMDWSYDLLSEPERILFRRLAVFAGGFSLEAAEAIGAGDGLRPNEILDLLSHLIDKSLVVADTQGRSEARYRLLETIRQYADTKLFESGEANAAHNRHLAFFIQFAETAEAQLGGAQQVQWLDRLEPDHDNFRSALKWSDENDQTLIGLRLAVALRSFWCVRGSYREGWQYFAELLSRPKALERTAARAMALYAAALLLPWGPSNDAIALALLEESLVIGREVGDKSAIAQSLSLLSLAALSRGDYGAAQSLAEEGLLIWRELNDEAGTAIILAHLGDAMIYQNNAEQAQACYEESLSLFTKLNDKNQTAHLFRQKGLAALHQGDISSAATLCGKSLMLNREIGSHSGIIASIVALSAVGAAQGEMTFAARLLGAVDAMLASDSVQIMAVDRRQFDLTVAAVRAQLREANFAQAWTEGQTLTLEQVITYSTNDPTILHADNTADLSLLALGPIKVWRGDSQLRSADWVYAKSKELLFYLLSHDTRTKEQIGLDLWPDVSPTQLRSNLGITLHHLRRALGRAEWIVFEKDQYFFNRALNYRFDVEMFESNLVQARQFGDKFPAQAIAHLETAIGLYRGEFMEDWMEGNWHTIRREELRRKYLDALLTLGQLFFVDEQYARAVDAYRRVIKHDNFLETAHRELMRCYVRMGERAQAMRHYQSLERLMHDEFGSPPASETVELYERLRRGHEV